MCEKLKQQYRNIKHCSAMNAIWSMWDDCSYPTRKCFLGFYTGIFLMQVNNITRKIMHARQHCHYIANRLFHVCSVAHTVSPLRPYFYGSTIKFISVQSCQPMVALISDLATVIKSLPTPLHICWHSTHLSHFMARLVSESLVWICMVFSAVYK